MDGQPEGRPSSAPRAIPRAPRPPALTVPRDSDDGATFATPPRVSAAADAALPRSGDHGSVAWSCDAFATSPLSAKLRSKWSSPSPDNGGAYASGSPRAEQLAQRMAAAAARRDAISAWVMGKARRLRREGHFGAVAVPSFLTAGAASPKTPGLPPQLTPHEAWARDGAAEGACAACVVRSAERGMSATNAVAVASG